MRDRAEEARKAHILEVTGSNPVPATKGTHSNYKQLSAKQSSVCALYGDENRLHGRVPAKAVSISSKVQRDFPFQKVSLDLR